MIYPFAHFLLAAKSVVSKRPRTFIHASSERTATGSLDASGELENGSYKKTTEDNRPGSSFCSIVRPRYLDGESIAAAKDRPFSCAPLLIALKMRHEFGSKCRRARRELLGYRASDHRPLPDALPQRYVDASVGDSVRACAMNSRAPRTADRSAGPPRQTRTASGGVPPVANASLATTPIPVARV